MIELPLVFVAGILGTGHCLGMCGPFALSIGSAAPNWSSALARQLAYTAGRVFTYGFLGAAAGFGGNRLAHAGPTVVNVPALLAVVAGALLIYQGLQGTGWLRKRSVRGSSARCQAGGFLRQFLSQPGASGVFLAGVFTGLLPCGLLYGMLALAMSTHHVFWGGATMMIFGLGTAPALVLAGLSGRLMSIATRRWLFAAAAWCLVFTGVVSVGRGVSFLSVGATAVSECPLCRH